MSANDTQVGGKHYRTGVQHWDFVAANRLPYFEAQISRYVARHAKKNGAEDLRKAYHYTKKLTELYEERVVGVFYPERIAISPAMFCQENGLAVDEKIIIEICCGWKHNSDLSVISSRIEKIITEKYGEKPDLF